MRLFKHIKKEQKITFKTWMIDFEDEGKFNLF